MAAGVSPLDMFSVLHLLSGAALAGWGLRARWSLLIIVGFEVFEALLRLVPVEEGFLFEYESFGNVVADVLIGVLGFVGAELFLRRMRVRRLGDVLRERLSGRA
jgi:hypothetical protein